MIKQEVLEEGKIFGILEKTKKTVSLNTYKNIFVKAREKKGLELEEIGCLLNISDPGLKQELFDTAAFIKEQIYGERLVFFAPMYVSDYCINDCDYCNFQAKNRKMSRKKLTLDEAGQQTEFLINMGHKRLLLEFGEDPANNTIEYVTEVIKKIYSVKTNKGNIRRLNVNIAATTKEDYKKLKEAQIGTYQLFQETYHRETYKSVHHGLKADYDRQFTAHERAYESGLDDFGLGVLFGLYDWRFEVLALVTHAQYLEKKYGVGPHTISVPRFCSAQTVTYKPRFPVSDDDFLKVIAILRLAVPYTGMIISTRERSELRKTAYKIGISQTSAGSVTSPGGYGKPDGTGAQTQFELHDRRSLSEVINDVLDDKFLPSFCTACYRSGRTGESFMELSKPGEIHSYCRPNGLVTFAEYLEDFADGELYKKGHGVISYYLNKIENETMRNKVRQYLSDIKTGNRDLFF